MWKENGAALTTLIAEATVFLIYLRVTRQYYTHLNGVKTMMQCIAGSAGIVMILYAFRNLECNIVIRIFVKISMSAIVYFALQIITKNQIIIDLYDNVLKKVSMTLGRKKK